MAKLTIIATPIGNLRDITLRAIEALEQSDQVLCEDTRSAHKLLRHFDIQKPLLSLYDQNELSRLPQIEELLNSGQNLALISENGSPLISDPGYKIVRALIKKGYEIDSVPGPSSAINALVLSGLTPDKFVFLGFVPKKGSSTKNLIELIKVIWQQTPTTIIFFDSPFRVWDNLKTFSESLQDPYVVIAREMTKIHQEIIRGRISALKVRKLKGELVVLLSPKDPFDY